MKAYEQFFESAAPESIAAYEDALAISAGGWVEAQRSYLDAMGRFVEDVVQSPDDMEISSHEAGGHCRPLITYYQIRGGERLVAKMRAVFDARRAWVLRSYYHGYVDCDEIHHEPETFLYFQVPFLYLTREPAVLESVEDFAHHAGNWRPEVPAWYDWESHGFRSTWLGTRSIRDYPPFDYQEANHFRFITAGLTVYLLTGRDRYLELAEDYAKRWCDHIESLAAKGEPIACSILPAGVGRKEVGSRVPTTEDYSNQVYPVFYETVAPNTATEVALTMLDLFRLTGVPRYREAARLMIAQFYDHATEEGVPATHFAEGAWRTRRADSGSEPLRIALSGQDQLLVRVTEKYRAVTGDTCFDKRILQWANLVDESEKLEDQLHVGLLAAAHRITGDSSLLVRACQMALRGLAATASNREWHLCAGTTRHGFPIVVEPLFDTILAASDYGLRGSLPMVGFEFHTGNERGLPAGVALRTWEPDPRKIVLELVNTSDADAQFRLASEGSGGSLLLSFVNVEGGSIRPSGDAWSILLRAGSAVQVHGVWEGRESIRVMVP